MLRLRGGGDVSDPGPGCCLLLNFFLLFGISYVLGVVFLHYSVSLVSGELATIYILSSDQGCNLISLQTDRANVATDPISIAKSPSTNCRWLCLGGGAQSLENRGHFALSIFKRFLYVTIDSEVSLCPNRTI